MQVFAAESHAPRTRRSIDVAKAVSFTVLLAGLSGAAFGAYGEGYLRLSYANSLENLMEAVDRIGNYLTS